MLIYSISSIQRSRPQLPTPKTQRVLIFFNTVLFFVLFDIYPTCISEHVTRWEANTIVSISYPWKKNVSSEIASRVLGWLWKYARSKGLAILHRYWWSNFCLTPSELGDRAVWSSEGDIFDDLLRISFVFPLELQWQCNPLANPYVN